MPITTTLEECQLDQPTGDPELDDLLAEAKTATGRNYQIVKSPGYDVKRLGIWHRVVQTRVKPRLYVEVPGVFPWQVISCAQDESTVFAYLYGLLNGVAE